MKRFLSCLNLSIFAFAAIIISLLASCSHKSLPTEKAIVAPERLKLRSSTAQAARVVGELKGGDQVTVTEHENAEDGEIWSKVTGPKGESGWSKSLNLVKQEIVEKSRQISGQIKDIPTQAIGKSKAFLKLRLTPDRSDDDNVATTLSSGTRLEIVARERKPRPIKVGESNDSDANVKYDTWYEVRLKNDSILPAGWIYGDSVELEVPPEIYYYVSSGRKIIGWQKIGTAPSEGQGSGEPFLALERKSIGADDKSDFDRIKVLAYDPSTRDYSTPFREDVEGKLPVIVRMDGSRGRIQIVGIDKNGQTKKLTYGVEILDSGKVKVGKPVIETPHG